ncbi:NUDIX domain-containing protein [uncultured Maribacter sp.]|uniref:NUDIX hydrolase n=1 Tax=uncultured Maribacter sp. TaxID=431308 RepID=UPI0030D729D4|tara:strand:- start:323 stop:1054 length:732 start_codon:yes stop_codon:yes gene_type:complete
MKKIVVTDYLPNLSIDCVIFGYKNKELKVLISKLSYGNNLWALPGGYVLKRESTDTAAARILQERTGLSDIYLDQFRVFGGENRIIGSPHKNEILEALKTLEGNNFDKKTIDWVTDRFVCVGYYALVDIDKVTPKTGGLEKQLQWESIMDLPKMTHDHNEIVTYAIKALRQNLDEKLIGFNLLPDEFTMKEVKQLYEVVYNKTFPMNNFQKKILALNVLERLGKKFTGAQNRAPFMYRFLKDQ